MGSILNCTRRNGEKDERGSATSLQQATTLSEMQHPASKKNPPPTSSPQWLPPSPVSLTSSPGARIRLDPAGETTRQARSFKNGSPGGVPRTRHSIPFGNSSYAGSSSPVLGGSQSYAALSANKPQSSPVLVGGQSSPVPTGRPQALQNGLVPGGGQGSPNVSSSESYYQSQQPSSKPRVVRELFSDSPKTSKPRLPREAINLNPTYQSKISNTLSGQDSPHAIPLSRHVECASSPVKLESSPMLDSSSVSGSSGCTVDVNYANVHELRVVGLSTEQAAAVVQYRVLRRQHFRTREEIRNIPQIDEQTWLRVKSRLTLVPSGPGVKAESSRVGANSRPHQPAQDSLLCDMANLKIADNIDSRKDDSAGRPSVDVNFCNYQELCIVGLSNSQANDLTNYRIKNGKFTSIEGIRNVPSISEADYQRVKSRLTLVPSGYSPLRSQKHSTPKKSPGRRRGETSSAHQLWNSPTGIVPEGIGNAPKPTVVYHTPPHNNNRLSHNGIGEGLNHRSEDSFTINKANISSSPRIKSPSFPKVQQSPRLSGAKPSGNEIRIATWNLQCFNEKKSDDPAVMEVVCSTILQNGFDILAVQEIGSKGALEKVCTELNSPQLPKIQSWGGNTRRWECAVSAKATGRMFMGMEYNGFLWNKSAGIQFVGVDTIDSGTDPQDRLFVRKPFAGKFLTGNWEFVIVSVHLKAENWGGKDRNLIEDEVGNLSLLMEASSCNGEDVILVGDFNMHPDDTCFLPLKRSGYSSIFDSTDPTNISAKNPDGDKCYDNMWVRTAVKEKRHNGVRRVVRRNLQHPGIPGKSPGEKGGTVSDHCPIWAGFRAFF